MAFMMKVYMGFFSLFNKITEDAFLLFARLYVADAFIRSGYLKATSWDSTLYLFENEYQVPFIPWEIAAYLGTIAEIVLPILLIIGLLSKFAALSLFIFNIIAVYSYPAIWQNGFWDHKLWGALMLFIVFYGAGKASIDAWICRKIANTSD